MKWLIVVGVSLVVLLFIYYLMGDEAPQLAAFPEELSSEPDALLEGATFQRFDEVGHLRFEIRASEGIFHEEDGYSQLSDLVMYVNNERRDQWILSAVDGDVQELESESRVSLKGAVEVTFKPVSGIPARIRTHEMVYFPERMLLESTEQVTIERERSKIRADKIEVNLATLSMQLHSNPDSQVEVLFQSDI